MSGEVLSNQPKRDLIGVGGWTRWHLKVTFSQCQLLILQRRWAEGEAEPPERRSIHLLQICALAVWCERLNHSLPPEKGAPRAPPGRELSMGQLLGHLAHPHPAPKPSNAQREIEKTYFLSAEKGVKPLEKQSLSLKG